MSTCMRIRVGLLVLCSVVLLGASPCSPDYQRSRNCSDLALTVEAGGPGVLLPDCLTPPQTMEVTLTEQISFTSVPSDLRAVIVPTPRSDTILISAISAAVPGTEVVRIHTEPRAPGLHQFAHDYRVTVSILPSSVPRFRIVVTVSGLAGTLMLHDSNAGDLTVAQDGSFDLPNLLPSGYSYSVTVSGAPPDQSCTVSNGSGRVVDADVTNISVACVNTYAIGGTVQGLTGTGLILVLSADGVDHPKTLDAPATSFTFPGELADGTSYEVRVQQQPTGPSQTCTVDKGGSGTVNGAAVTDVSVSCGSTPPPPPPPGFTVSVTANPLVTPTGGSTTLSAIVSGGIGPFSYAWRGYRDDGSSFSYTLSNSSAAQPIAALVFPGSDFYFFVTVTDTGAGGAKQDAYVRVHEADDVVARFTVSPSVIHAGVTTVTFDASASTGVVTPIGWTVQYLGDVARPSDIEGWLKLQDDSQGTLFWNNILFTTSDLFTLDLAKENFASPGAYRMLLQANGDISTHQTYEYFYVDP